MTPLVCPLTVSPRMEEASTPLLADMWYKEEARVAAALEPASIVHARNGVWEECLGSMDLSLKARVAAALEPAVRVGCVGIKNQKSGWNAWAGV